MWYELAEPLTDVGMDAIGGAELEWRWMRHKIGPACLIQCVVQPQFPERISTAANGSVFVNFDRSTRFLRLLPSISAAEFGDDYVQIHDRGNGNMPRRAHPVREANATGKWVRSAKNTKRFFARPFHHWSWDQY